MNKSVCLLSSANPAFDFRLFHKQCKSLAQAGYDVTLIVHHSKDEMVDGVRLKAIPKSRTRLTRMTWTVWSVYREAVRQRADIYLFPDPELIPVGLLLRFLGKRVVYDIRELLALQFLTKDYLPRWARAFCGRAVAWLQRLAVPRLSAALAATPSIAAQLRNTRKQGIVTIVQNFPSATELSPKDCLAWEKRPNWAVYVGRITVLRGIREIVEAVELLPSHLAVSLKIAGQFDSERLQGEVSRLPGWKRTEYLGVLDRPGMWKLLGQARFGLVTLHPSRAHMDTWPVKLFEFMCAGIPVIASDFPLWREIVEGAGCGLLVDPLRPEAIAEAIEYLLAHAGEAEAMGCRGRAAVEARYNWAFEESKLLRLFERLLNNRDGEFQQAPSV